MNRDIAYFREYDLSSLTKKILLEDQELLCGLARWNEGFAKSGFVQDSKILVSDAGVCAEWLAEYSVKNGWGETEAAQKLEVLELRYGKVARLLAIHSKKNGWGETPAANDLKVLKLCGGDVAKWLAEGSPENGWGKLFLFNDKGFTKKVDFWDYSLNKNNFFR